MSEPLDLNAADLDLLWMALRQFARNPSNSPDERADADRLSREVRYARDSVTA